MKQQAIFLALTTCAFASAWDSPAGEPATKRNAEWVRKRVQAWQATKAERAFDQIGWAASLREAQRLGKQHQRPVFLFTYDGASLSGYRC
ncbi:MAG: hypothetical protein FJ271_08955 [Planctomycetes bacterium]|nr:hypothetical protein [Planctomycetota bacterium]